MAGQDGFAFVSLWSEQGSKRVSIDYIDTDAKKLYLQRGVINNYFMESSSDQAARNMLKLLPSLHQKVLACRRERDGDTLASVSSPYVKAGITGASVDGKKVEIRMKASKNRAGSELAAPSLEQHVTYSLFPYFFKSEDVGASI